MKFLEQIQEDFFARLLADEYFSHVPLILQRKALTEQEVVRQLSVRNARAGCVGACVIVLMPVIVVSSPNLPGPSTTVKQSLLFLEHPTINAGSQGTMKSAEQLGVAGLQLFHHFIPFGVSQVFVADPDAMVPNFDFEGLVGYDVNLSSSVALRKPAKVITPTIAPNGGAVPAMVTLSCATADADIYWTRDGSYPSSENPNATLYAGPFSFTQGGTFRAGAQISGSQQSDIARALFDLPHE